MDKIEDQFAAKCKERSDINEHLPTLRRYAKECETICEMGVRGIVSTWALLAGLMDSEHQNKRMVCVDIVDTNMDSIRDIARKVGINVMFMKGDSATLDLPLERTDMLFIDTWHVYGHLKRELIKHHAKVNKYIVMHDTEIDKIHGESLRNRENIPLQSKQTGYPEEEIACGLEKVIEEFLIEHENKWAIHERFTNNNGLTILKRII